MYHNKLFLIVLYLAIFIFIQQISSFWTQINAKSFQNDYLTLYSSSYPNSISFRSSNIKLMKRSNDVCLQELVEAIDQTSSDIQDHDLNISLLLLESNSTQNNPKAKHCKFPSDMHYHLLSFIKTNSSYMYFEFCVPTICTVKHVESAIMNIQSTLLISDESGASQKSPSRVIDPPELDAFFFISIFFLGAILISVLIGTIYYRRDSIPEPPKNPKEKTRNSLAVVVEVSEENLSDTSYEILLSRKAKNNSTLIDPLLDNKEAPNVEGKLLQILRCFNLAENWKILTVSEDEFENLKVFDGIKALGICWIICALTFSINTNQNKSENVQMISQNSWWTLVVAGSLLAVDIFFYLSGLFAGLFLLIWLEKVTCTIKNYTLALLHRLARLWPTYFVVLLVFWKIIPYVGEGPFWHKYLNLTGQCTAIFWKNLLMIDGIWKDDNDSCFGWGWYLASNIQMFLISLVVCWTYTLNSRAGKGLTIIIILAGLSLTMIFAFETEVFFALPLESNMHAFYNFYFNTAVHIAPYFLGMLAGIVYKEYKEGNINLFSYFEGNKKLIWSFSILGMTLMSLMFLYPGASLTDSSKHNIFTSIWIALNGFLYTFGFNLLAILWLAEKMRWVTKSLGARWLTILGRLSFGMYLTSFVVVQIHERTKENLETFSIGNRMWTAVVVIVITVVAAICLTLIVEIPFIRLEALVEERIKIEKKSEDCVKVAMGEVQKNPIGSISARRLKKNFSLFLH